MFTKNRLVSFCLIGYILLISGGGLYAEPGNEFIPVETLMRPLKLQNAQLSPDGRYVSGNAPMDNGEQHGLVVIDLDGMSVKRSIKLSPGTDIVSHFWVANDEIVFHSAKWNYFTDGLYGLTVGEKQIRPLIKNDALAQILDPMRDDPEFALIKILGGNQMNERVMKLEKSSYARTRDGLKSVIPATRHNQLLSDQVDPPKGQIFDWYTDWDSQVRIVTRYYEGNYEILHRDSPEDDWQVLPLDGENWGLIHVHPGKGSVFTSDNRSVYITGYHGHNTVGLYTYNLDTGELGEAQFRDTEFNLDATVDYKFYNRNLVGLTYEQDRPVSVWFLPKLKKIQERVDGILQGRINIIHGWSENFQRHLIYSLSDVTPVEYYLLDLERGKVVEVAKSAPWLDYERLARTQVFRIKTSDGLKLQGYLTIPKTGKAPYPTVCLVHGGPWARDSGIYDERAQLLANRGYAVLRVNYRGSSGFGKEISYDQAFDFKGMHNDITEAVKMAIKGGVVDPDRVAIMGSSFGGYATICGVSLEPELYQCAVALRGVYDWESLMRSLKRKNADYSHDRLQEKLMTGTLIEPGAFNFLSPIDHVENIQVPVLVSHGKLDKRVPIRQSRDLEAKLKEHGVPHETYYPKEQRHSVFKQKERIELYNRILAFLDEHLGQ